LEIELCEKKEKEIKAKKLMKDEVIAGTKDTLKERKKELKIKNGELDEITKETEKEEKSLIKKSDKAQKVIEDRLLNAYSRIRTNVRNGLAVVSVDRDACGGCKNMIPPQRQLDIRMHKKVIVCEHCGRILIDANMFDK
jgi:predicted  nucleic acid-binding Zn-ribbon protein